MINNEKIGVGIVTYNRRPGLLKLISSLPRDLIDSLIVVNDGERYPELDDLDCHVHHNTFNEGVGCSKNTALKYLRGQGVDHYFLIEDDIFVKDSTVFEKYIELSFKTGIQHFNFSQHGPNNTTAEGEPEPHYVVSFEDYSLPLFGVCVGAFCYFSKLCIEKVGFFDEFYYNAMEHLDHTLGVINAGLHPSWFYFADLHNSHHYLGDEGWSEAQSTHAGSSSFRARAMAAGNYFIKKMVSYLVISKSKVLRQLINSC